MRRYIPLVLTLAVASSCYSAAQAFTITFEESPAGSVISWYDQGINSVGFSSFRVMDHSAAAWGLPHSGSNVLGWSGSGAQPMIGFGYRDAFGLPIVGVQWFAAYFSTAPGAVLTMTVYHGDPPHGSSIESFQIGSYTEPWNNQYLEVCSPTGEINSIGFQAVSSNALSGFCLDDLTVTPVPEPSSLAALFCGLVGVGGVVVRRRRAR